MFDFDALPKPSEKRIAIHVKPAAERALRAGHPWLFDQAIRKQSRDGQPGDLAVIFDSKDRFLAVGLYDPDSPIRVKVLQHGKRATINENWFRQKIGLAVTRRQPLNTPDTNTYRLVHGENDGLPGLIVDRYADTLVMKLYTGAWLPHLADVVAGLQSATQVERLVLRLSRNMQDATEGVGLVDGQTLVGDAVTAPVVVRENGLLFKVDVVQGHKTGFFCDQRDNRARVRDLAAGRRVLDVFAYTGGFSVYAAAGGAQSVTSLDVSAPALAAAKANFDLNHDQTNVAQARHSVMVEDAFAGMERLFDEGRSFDIVVVDPPSFAKSADEVDGALHAYARLTRLALNLTEPGGVLVMASCSSRVSMEAFFDTVTHTVKEAGRSIEEIERTGHALDHPIGFPEGEYLKCLFARVQN